MFGILRGGESIKGKRGEGKFLLIEGYACVIVAVLEKDVVV